MREIINESNEWRQNDEQIALATVVRTWGSAPRKVGAKMALTSGGAMAGSVSGGCVEGAVVEAGMETLHSGGGKLLEFGVADETAWTVGLACGGMIDVFVEPFDADLQQIVSGWVANELAGAVATVIGTESAPDALIGRKIAMQNGSVVYDTYQSDMYRPMILYAIEKALKARQGIRYLIPDSTVEIFVDVIMPSPTLIIVGGVHIAQALIELAQVMGFKPTVIDPRRAFGSTERFPDVPLIQQWPRKAFPGISLNESTAIALLTHDPKIDDQALAFALPSSAFYIGALGSKKTAATRNSRLVEAGYTQEQIDRIHGPIGLNINAQTPEEIALAVMGEIISAYRS